MNIDLNNTMGFCGSPLSSLVELKGDAKIEEIAQERIGSSSSAKLKEIHAVKRDEIKDKLQVQLKALFSQIVGNEVLERFSENSCFPEEVEAIFPVKMDEFPEFRNDLEKAVFGLCHFAFGVDTVRESCAFAKIEPRLFSQLRTDVLEQSKRYVALKEKLLENYQQAKKGIKLEKTKKILDVREKSKHDREQVGNLLKETILAEMIDFEDSHFRDLPKELQEILPEKVPHYEEMPGDFPSMLHALCYASIRQVTFKETSAILKKRGGNIDHWKNELINNANFQIALKNTLADLWEKKKQGTWVKEIALSKKPNYIGDVEARTSGDREKCKALFASWLYPLIDFNKPEFQWIPEEYSPLLHEKCRALKLKYASQAHVFLSALSYWSYKEEKTLVEVEEIAGIRKGTGLLAKWKNAVLAHGEKWKKITNGEVTVEDSPIEETLVLDDSSDSEDSITFASAMQNLIEMRNDKFKSNLISSEMSPVISAHVSQNIESTPSVEVGSKIILKTAVQDAKAMQDFDSAENPVIAAPLKSIMKLTIKRKERSRIDFEGLCTFQAKKSKGPSEPMALTIDPAPEDFF